MASGVDFVMGDILQFWRELQEFSGQMEDIVQRMNGALNTVRETWRDHQLEKPASDILDANAQIMGIVGELCPTVEDFLHRQEQWHDEYVSI